MLRFAFASPLLLGAFALPFCSGNPIRDVVSAGKNVSSSDVREVGSAAAQESREKDECLKGAKRPVGWQEEYEIGGAVAVAFATRQGGLVSGLPNASLDKVSEYVNVVGQSITARSPRPNITWVFGVLQSDAVNAFSAPGGYVFVTTGLLKRLDNEAQLAGVLSHEVAHVTLKHALNNYQAVKEAQCTGGQVLGTGLAVAGNRARGVLPGEVSRFVRMGDLRQLKGPLLKEFVDKVIDSIVTQGNSKEAEYQSDALAMDLMVSAGYQPKEYVNFVRKLPGGGTFANHPTGDDRAEALDKHLKASRQAGAGGGFTAYDGLALDKLPVVPLRGQLKAVGGK